MHGYEGCLEKERTALLEIKELFLNSSVNTNYDRVNSKLGSWVDDRVSDCCNWNRVRGVFKSFSKILYLQLIISYLVYKLCFFSIGAGLANLRNLEFLDLSGNRINGSTLQDELKNFINLDLSRNNFEGHLPTCLNNLTSLRAFDLSFNQITNIGSFASHQESFQKILYLQLIISFLSNLRNLEVLDLSGNEISGTLQELVGSQFEQFRRSLSTCLNNLTNIRALDLSSNQLSGNISSDIQNLMTPLEYLSLEDNNFEGLFSFILETENFLQPPNQLKVLYLSNCNLHAIPSFVMYQHSLEFIDLSHNKMVGTFPTWLLHNNTRLQDMNLMNNSFTGILQLPNSTHDLLQLTISENNMTGQLPKNMGTILPRLSYLNLSRNSFEGHIPSSMGEMKGLKTLDLSSNNFLGELPKSFISGCFSLEFLRLSNNNFHGEIFPEFMNMTQLNWLYLDNNKFSGNIQKGLLKAAFLYMLDLSNNSFSSQIPHWIGNFSNLLTLSMSNNLLEGGVPVQLSNIKRLVFLDISKNRLSGSITSSTNLSSVRYLYMQKNALSGSIPNAFFRSSESVILDLRDNEFSGSIPNEIDDGLSNLQFLLLAGNHLEGYIPHELCRLQNVSILDLSRNKLNGTIPSCFTNMSFWLLESEDLTLSTELSSYESNSFSFASYNFTLHLEESAIFKVSYGKLEVDFVTKNRAESYKGSILQYMTGIDLLSNELTGEVPSEFGHLQNIHAVNLSHNSLSGSIPESFSHLKNIESLDLSHNKLSSRIPPQLIELNYLGTFNVTFNHLSGPVPDQEQFGAFDESNYRGNPSLCGSQIKRSCEPTASPASPLGDEEEEYESSIDMVSFYWSFFASNVTTILGQWFYFIDECIITCHCWILRYVFRMYR
ncbi:hypothetical protein ACOSQ2_032092 [Xanthoceras sorbifolium]